MIVTNAQQRGQLIEDIRSRKMPFMATIKNGGARSLQQNAYLWGVCYPTIIDAAGESLAGWTSNDLHEYFLGEHNGWITLDGFGRKRQKPLERSSTMSKTEFMAYVAFIQQKAAEMNIYIPDPGEM